MSLVDFLLGVMPHCLDAGTVKEIVKERFTGSEWEKSMSEAGEYLTSRSKSS